MATLGERLRESRQQRQFELAEISQMLKIRLSVLEALETDQPGPLPPLYMRQFALRYGQFLGIPDTELRELLRQRFGPEGSSVPKPPPVQSLGEREAEARLRVARALVYGGLVGAVVAVVHYFFLRSEPQRTPGQEEVAPVVIRSAKEPSEGEGANRADTLWQLRIRAQDTVWLSIVVDNSQSAQFLLYPGQEREWSVRELATLSVGNAGGLRIWRNGYELPPLGPPGSVVRMVRITAHAVEGVPVGAVRKEKEETRRNRDQQRAEETLSISPAPVLSTPEVKPEPQKPLPLPQ